MLKEVKKEPKSPKKPNLFYRFLVFLVTVGLLAGAVGVVANRDKFNFDALRRFFAYRSTTQSDVGSTAPFPYEGGVGASFARVGGDMLSVSPSGFRLYSSGGALYVEETLPMEHPTCTVSGDRAVAYDAGGAELQVYRNREQVFSLHSEDGAILSARLNANGYLAVVTRATGFKGVVTVYDPGFQKRIAFRISSTYILDAVVSPDNKSVAVITAGQNGYAFESTLVTYAITDTPAAGEGDADLTPTGTLSLGNRVPLDLRWSGGSFRVLTEYGVVTADADLVQTGSRDWSDRHLKLFSQDGDDFTVALLGKYQAGSQAQLLVTDHMGTAVGTLEFSEQVLSLSAAGRYFSVLTADRLEIYTKNLDLYSTLEGTQGARQTTMRPDGTAMLISNESAWVYIPA